jgi:hypothetical protein
MGGDRSSTGYHRRRQAQRKARGRVSGVGDRGEVLADNTWWRSDAHASGGWAWPAERKVAFANDLEDTDELNATWGPENERKADYGPDRWQPPNKAFRCAYVAAYARIKARWELTVSPAQWAAVERVWSGCEGSP